MLTMLRWWFITCLSGFGMVVAANFDFYSYLWQNDATKLSFVIIGIFVVSVVFIGMLTYHARDGDQTFTRHLSLMWYMAEKLLTLGMMGTLIGFLITFQTFGGKIDFGNAVASQLVLGQMGLGLSTAALTTLVGLACGSILKLLLINLEYQLTEE